MTFTPAISGPLKVNALPTKSGWNKTVKKVAMFAEVKRTHAVKLSVLHVCIDVMSEQVFRLQDQLQIKLRVRYFGKKDQWCEFTLIAVNQRTRWIHFEQRFSSCFDPPLHDPSDLKSLILFRIIPKERTLGLIRIWHSFVLATLSFSYYSIYFIPLRRQVSFRLCLFSSVDHLIPPCKNLIYQLKRYILPFIPR